MKPFFSLSLFSSSCQSGCLCCSTKKCWHSSGNIWLCPPSIHSVGEDRAHGQLYSSSTALFTDSASECRVYERKKCVCAPYIPYNKPPLLPLDLCLHFSAPSVNKTPDSSHLASSSHLHGHFCKRQTVKNSKLRSRPERPQQRDHKLLRNYC